MAEHETALAGRRTGAGVSVREGAPRAMIAIRHDPEDGALREALRTLLGALPSTGEALSRDGRTVLWMAPDEMLVLAGPSERGELTAALREAATDHFALVEDVSDMRALIVLEGDGWRDVLARLTPADVSPAALPPGRVRRSRIGQVAAAFWAPDASRAELLCFRSVATYAFDLLADAASGPPLELHDAAGG